MTNEKRLIDANEVLQRNEEAFKKAKAKPNEHFVGVIQYHTVKEMVNPSPTVDAVEVVHGRWEPVDHDGSWRVDRCSVCHRRMHYVDYNQPYQYCPNCGAKMDGDGNG